MGCRGLGCGGVVAGPSPWLWAIVRDGGVRRGGSLWGRPPYGPCPSVLARTTRNAGVRVCARLGKPTVVQRQTAVVRGSAGWEATQTASEAACVAPCAP